MENKIKNRALELTKEINYIDGKELTAYRILKQLEIERMKAMRINLKLKNEEYFKKFDLIRELENATYSINQLRKELKNL